jgi:hypothetical protein
MVEEDQFEYVDETESRRPELKTKTISEELATFDGLEKKDSAVASKLLGQCECKLIDFPPLPSIAHMVSVLESRCVSTNAVDGSEHYPIAESIEFVEPAAPAGFFAKYLKKIKPFSFSAECFGERLISDFPRETSIRTERIDELSKIDDLGVDESPWKAVGKEPDETGCTRGFESEDEGRKRGDGYSCPRNEIEMYGSMADCIEIDDHMNLPTVNDASPLDDDIVDEYEHEHQFTSLSTRKRQQSIYNFLPVSSRGQEQVAIEDTRSDQMYLPSCTSEKPDMFDCQNDRSFCEKNITTEVIEPEHGQKKVKAERKRNKSVISDSADKSNEAFADHFGMFTVEEADRYSQSLLARVRTAQSKNSQRKFRLKPPGALVVAGAPSDTNDALSILRRISDHLAKKHVKKSAAISFLDGNIDLLLERTPRPRSIVSILASFFKTGTKEESRHKEQLLERFPEVTPKSDQLEFVNGDGPYENENEAFNHFSMNDDSQDIWYLIVLVTINVMKLYVPQISGVNKKNASLFELRFQKAP